MNATLQFNDSGKITGIYQEWRFDKGYSASAIEGLDANKDGYFDSQELEPLSRENLSALKDYNYFTYLTKNNEKVKFGPISEYNQQFSNEKLTMTFTISLKEPIDPKKSKITLKIFDPSFYIAMDFQKSNPVGASGKIPPVCKIKLLPIPADEEIDKMKKMLATKGKNWTAAPEEEFGALFAQPLVIDCSQGGSS